MDYQPTTVISYYSHRPASDRTAVVYENAHHPGRFHVRLELRPEHTNAGGNHGFYGGSRPYAGPNYTELEAMAIGLLWEQYGLTPEPK